MARSAKGLASFAGFVVVVAVVVVEACRPCCIEIDRCHSHTVEADRYTYRNCSYWHNRDLEGELVDNTHHSYGGIWSWRRQLQLQQQQPLQHC